MEFDKEKFILKNEAQRLVFALCLQTITLAPANSSFTPSTGLKLDASVSFSLKNT